MFLEGSYQLWNKFGRLDRVPNTYCVPLAADCTSAGVIGNFIPALKADMAAARLQSRVPGFWLSGNPKAVVIYIALLPDKERDFLPIYLTVRCCQIVCVNYDNAYPKAS